MTLIGTVREHYITQFTEAIWPALYNISSQKSQYLSLMLLLFLIQWVLLYNSLSHWIQKSKGAEQIKTGHEFLHPH